MPFRRGAGGRDGPVINDDASGKLSSRPCSASRRCDGFRKADRREESRAAVTGDGECGDGRTDGDRAGTERHQSIGERRLPERASGGLRRSVEDRLPGRTWNRYGEVEDRGGRE